MAKLETSIYLVAISAANPGDGHISRFFKICEYRLCATFGDSNGVGDVADARVGVAAEMHKHVSVVRKKCPLATDF